MRNPAKKQRQIPLCWRILHRFLGKLYFVPGCFSCISEYPEYIATCFLDRCWRIAVFEGNDDFCLPVTWFGQPPTH